MSAFELVGWTDGGCRGNPGPGAWAFLLLEPATGRALERAEAEEQTTNNRMELLGAIHALRAIRRPGRALLLHSDSQYLIKAVTAWMPTWKQRGWRTKSGPVKNLELMQELDALLEIHRVRWQWVRGHAGNPGNERVDRLVNEAMDRLASGRKGPYEQRCLLPGFWTTTRS